MEKQTMVLRKCHMRYNKKTDTYTVVRGSSYFKKTKIEPKLS